MIKEILKLIRVRQWLTNLIIFSAIVFSGNLTDIAMLTKVILSFLIFCLLSSGGYIFNDLLNRKKDRKHLIKMNRPFATESLTITTGIILFTVFTGLGLILSYIFSRPFFNIAMSYFIFVIIYSLILREIVIVDIITSSFVYILRVIAGGVVIGVGISNWLLVCTGLLALFLNLSKRRQEVVLLGNNAKLYRKTLNFYTVNFLDSLLLVVFSITFMAYILYTMWPETIDKFNGKNLLISIPFVFYGLTRFLMLSRKFPRKDIVSIFFSDLFSIGNLLLWIVSVIIVIYF